MLFEFSALIFCLVVLGKSADLVVDHVTNISKFLKISSLAVGFLLVAFTTSLPEFTISILSSTSAQGEIAAGNVFGSNIANILLILGIGSLLYGVKISEADKKEIRVLLLSTSSITFFIFVLTYLLHYSLSLFDGLLLLSIFVIYCIYSLKKKPSPDSSSEVNITKKEVANSFVLFFVGIFLVFISSSFVVQFSISLAETAGFSKSFIGSTFVAIGTSLPELSTAIAALRKKEYSLAIGDAIGSNLVNLTLVLGSAATISPISSLVLPIFVITLIFAIFSDAILFIFSSFFSSFNRIIGALFLICYLLYLILIFNFQLSAVI
jgi:cation:H+ antiporter